MIFFEAILVEKPKDYIAQNVGVNLKLKIKFDKSRRDLNLAK